MERAEEQKWKFPIENLNDKLGGIGPGVFGLISARPNAGKTAMCISCVFHPEGWAAQGAKIGLFCNEEAAFRTKKRGITCYSGVTPENWEDNMDFVKESWGEIMQKFYSKVLIAGIMGLALGGCSGPEDDGVFVWWENTPPEAIGANIPISASWRVVGTDTVEMTKLSACPPGVMMDQCDAQSGRIDSAAQMNVPAGTFSADLALSQAGDNWMIFAVATVDGEMLMSSMQWRTVTE